MSAPLSPYRLGKARELYNIFNFFNSFSYALLAGNIITLYALRLNASSTLVGALSAMIYCSFFFMPLGKALLKKFPIVPVFATAWLLRAVSMVPVVFAPIAVRTGRHDIAMGLMLAGVMGFHMCRGIGTIGNNPVLHSLAAGPDRGSYITLIQIINSGVSMFSGFALALLLGRNPPLGLYSIIFSVGIASGIFGALLLYKIPEPENSSDGGKVNFFQVSKEALSEPSFRQFVIIFFTISFVASIARTFIVVYSREVFFQTDGMVSLYTVFGGLGALMMGLIIKFLVDRVGAKPLYITCTIVSFISLLPVLFFPSSAIESATTVILFLASVQFLINFGFIGAEGVAQNYFFALIPSKYMLNLGILYYFVFGLAGAGGSFLAGVFLDILMGFGLTGFISYKVLFGILVVILGLMIFAQRKLVPLGALPFRGALEVMFSFKDLRAITLLDRLEKTKDTKEEEELLEALHVTPSRLALKGLLDRAKSPRLAVRIESFRALEPLDTLTEQAEQTFKDDVINNPYTTAYISARILGNHGVFSAIPLLRERITSDDYMLAGECMIALARLQDTEYLPAIEKLIVKTKNPRLKIMGVSALGIYGSPNSVSVLLDLLRAADPPPYLRDEVVLALSSILDIQNQYYPLLVRYLENPELGATLALDEAEAAYEYYLSISRRRGKKKNGRISPAQAKALYPAVASYANELNGAALSKWILQLPHDTSHTIVQVVLSEAVLDDDLTDHGRLRLLIAKWSAHQLRFWSKQG
ncbi:MFS transporter [Breznakiella homolactica]|uniref:MFS transporter n=1 Tax=Breznakiella homolactica TaxID=2798577 RepID=A0A7T7XMY9_9SPIR|nr:MFS transporter [Breznakiella homolactica]QQO09263.1 MFS transporter [Breznakiella homolactica]